MDNAPTFTPEAPAPPERKSAIDRIIGVFFEPTETFADIARAPSALAAAALIVVIAMAASSIVVNKVDMRDFISKQFDKNPRMDSMPKEQKAQAIERGGNPFCVFSNCHVNSAASCTGCAR